MRKHREDEEKGKRKKIKECMGRVLLYEEKKSKDEKQIG